MLTLVNEAVMQITYGRYIASKSSKQLQIVLCNGTICNSRMPNFLMDL